MTTTPTTRPRNINPNWPPDRVLQARERNGHSLTAAAVCMGISRRTLIRWEQGDTPAHDATMRMYVHDTSPQIQAEKKSQIKA